LTCDFWAENGKRKIEMGAKVMKSVGSSFGPRSGLRQSSDRCAVGLRGTKVPALILQRQRQWQWQWQLQLRLRLQKQIPFGNDSQKGNGNCEGNCEGDIQLVGRF
jgi:hypothetical protein